MASGNSLLILLPMHGVPPATTGATLDTIAGASTPAEAVPCLDFDDTTVEHIDFLGVMPSAYAGGGITLTFIWSAAQAAASGTFCVWSAAFRLIDDDLEDLDTTAFTYDYNLTGQCTPASAIGEVAYDTLTFTDGADMDSVVANKYFILRVRRVPTDGNDTHVGDCSLHALLVKET